MQNKEQQDIQKFFGYYLALDLYDCEPETVGDLKIGYSYLDGLATILRLKKLSPPFIICTDEKKYPDKAGLSGWVPFMDPASKTFSGASIHTLTPTNFISIDIYSGRKLDREKIKEFTLKVFKSKKIEEQYLLRGENYIHP